MGGTAVGGKRISVYYAAVIGNSILVKLRAANVISEGAIAGSTRRRYGITKATVGDIDLVVVPKDRVKFGIEMHKQYGQSADPKRQKYSFKHKGGVQVDVLVAERNSFGAAMMHSTGPVALNIRQRIKAKQYGLVLNEKGLWNKKNRIAGATEKEVYAVLTLKYLKPSEREEFNYEGDQW